jgi:hypothetical protein
MSKRPFSQASAVRQLINLLRCLAAAIQTKVIDPESAKLCAAYWPRRLDPTKNPVKSLSKKLPRDKAYSTKVTGLLSLNWFEDLDSVLPLVEDWLECQPDVDPGIDEFYRLTRIRKTARCLQSRLRHGYRGSELLDGLKPADELLKEIIWWANSAFDWWQSFAVPPPNPPNRIRFGPYTARIIRGDGPEGKLQLVFPCEVLQDDSPAASSLNNQSAKAPRDDSQAKAKESKPSQDMCKAYLLSHHGYHGTVTAYELNQTPATPKEMDEKCITSASSATRFFKARWRSHKEYKRICDNPDRLLTELRFLAGDVNPRELKQVVEKRAEEFAAKGNPHRQSIDEND